MAEVQYVIFRLEDEYYGAEIQNIPGGHSSRNPNEGSQ